MTLDDALKCLELWADRFAHRDCDGLAALYHEDALLFGSAEGLVCGRDAIRGYFAALPKGGVAKAEFSDLVVKATSPASANVAGIVCFAMQESTILMRISLAFAQNDGAWLIGMHHASAIGGTAFNTAVRRAD